MKIILDFQLKKSIADQLAETLRRAILAAELQPGEQLPTVRQLAAQTRVNFNTVARVYRLLDREGWISTQQGRGTYVLARPAARARPEPLPRRVQVAQAIAAQITAQAQRLGIPARGLQREVARQLWPAGERPPAKSFRKGGPAPGAAAGKARHRAPAKKTQRRPRGRMPRRV